MILDLSDTEPPHALDRLIHEAEVRDLIDEATLRRFLVDAVGRKGRRVLDAILADYEATGAMTDEELERLFLSVVVQAGLPEPIIHADIHADEVDFHWPEHRLVVETDGWRFHKTRRRFEADRKKTNRLTANGQRVMRYTWRRVYRSRNAVAAELTEALAWRLVPASLGDRRLTLAYDRSTSSTR